jgi:myo-inositol 2-dehydrogenase/D-chiro-inositol 1-dehydrogenase
MNKQIGIGIIGAGRIAQVHTANIAQIKEAKLIAVADILEEAAKKLASKYEIKYYTDYRKLLQNDNIDAVIICTPPHTHAQIMIESAEAGKHIFCEKPMTTTLEDAEKVISVVKKNRVKLMVGFMLRFTPPHPQIKEMINKGVIGNIIIMKADVWGWAPVAQWSYEPDKGMGVFDVAIHHIDLFRWFSGEIDRVYVRGGAFVLDGSKRYGTPDNIIILLSFKNNVLGDIYCSFSTGYGNLLMQIHGEKGSIFLNYLDKQSLTLFLKEGFKDNSTIIPAGWSYPDVLWTYGYRGEIEHFINCILEDKEPLITGKDGKDSLEVLLACKESLITDKIVKLPLK